MCMVFEKSESQLQQAAHEQYENPGIDHHAHCIDLVFDVDLEQDIPLPVANCNEQGEKDGHPDQDRACLVLAIHGIVA